MITSAAVAVSPYFADPHTGGGSQGGAIVVGRITWSRTALF
jgi:hypothetical protein